MLWESGNWLLYGFLTPAVFAVSKRLSLVRPQLARRALLHLGISLLFCVTWATCGKLLQLGLWLLFDPREARAAMQAGAAQFYRQAGVGLLSWVFFTLAVGGAVYLCLVCLGHAVRYLHRAPDTPLQL